MCEIFDSVAAMCASHAPMEPNARFPVGSIFGDWRLTAFIGRGGSGEVYCAEHVRLGTSAAVKVLVRDDARAKERFSREARLLSELKSDAFPRFFAYDEANGHAYLAMELLEPGDLPSGDRAVAQFMVKVCDAVAELHAQGFVHRDIKPGNILWRSPSEPVLTDLGLAKDIAAAPLNHPDESLTVVDGRRAGVGTPGYGAPEQMERGEATFASDIHALGVLADRCFGGNPPQSWKRIIERATSSIPGRRYLTVASFSCAIRKRHWTLYLTVCLSVLVLMVLAAGFLRGKADRLWVEQREKRDAPVLDALAVVDGMPADGARWFLDDLPVDMPHSFVRKPGDKQDWLPRRLCAVVWRNGKTYSAKRTDIIPSNWTGRRRLSLELREDPPAGTIVKMFAKDGTPFEFAWCSPHDAAEGGSGFWIARTKLSVKQFASVVKANPHLRHKPPRSDHGRDFPVAFHFLGVNTVPVVSLDGSCIRLEPPDFHQWRRGRSMYVDMSAEMPEWAGVPPSQKGDGFSDGGWMRMDGTGHEACISNHSVGGIGGISPSYVRYMAVSRFWYETNMVLYCTARELLRSGKTADVAHGESMMRSFSQSDDMELRTRAEEFCIERGMSTLDDLGGTNASVRLRFAAVRHGDAAVLERLAVGDPDPDVRKAAYEKLANPSPMVSAKYIAQIRAEDNPGDISKPLRTIGALRDRDALVFLAEHGRFGYFRDEARARLKTLDRK